MRADPLRAGIRTSSPGGNSDVFALAPEDRCDALILVPTHAIRQQVNGAAREGLEAEGLLHGRLLAITAWWTAA